MIYAFHLTWTTYGHWFPNDPRGSWSQEVWQPALKQVRELERTLDTTHQMCKSQQSM